MTGTIKPKKLSQPMLICSIMAEISKQIPQATINEAQFRVIIEAANQVASAFKPETGAV